MPKRMVRLDDQAWEADGARLAVGVAAVQQELGVTADFPPEVRRVAEAAARDPRVPQVDRTDLPLVTLDPASARDLDQALHIERDGDGYVVHYAIADLHAFLDPGDAVDTEAMVRGETLYGADSKIPLHPKAISEGTASLFPDQDTPAVLWTMRVDATGEGTEARVERALVRSRAKLDYDGVQAAFDDGTVDPMLALLREVGELRLAREVERGGVTLPLPSQEIHVDEDGHWQLSYRTPLPVELWNAQISLLTGMAAASIMLEHGVGILRTLPPADPRDIARLRRTAKALRVPWPQELDYPAFIRSVDASTPSGAAVLVAATRTLRGAAYVAFDGEAPEQPRHSALASEYAHVTAPLRRLVDRFGTEVCLAACAGVEVPTWIRDRLHALPSAMAESSRRAGTYERALLDLVEAALLCEHLDRTFEGVVISVDEKRPTRGKVMLSEPAVEAPVQAETDLPLGEEVRVRLVEADVTARKVSFVLEP